MKIMDNVNNIQTPKRAKIIKDSIFLTLGMIINYFFTLVGAIVTARLLTPVNYGIWKTIQLALQYGSFANLGINNGVSKLAPSLYSSGKNIEFRNIIFNALTIGLSIPSIILAVCIGLQFILKDSQTKLIVLVFGISLFFALIYDTCEIMLAVMKKFTLKGILNAVYAIGKVAILIAATYFYSLKGFLFAFVILTIITALIDSYIVQLPFKGSCDARYAKLLFKHSLPITFMLIAETIFFTTDRFIVTTFLGKEEFGIYSLGLIITPFIMMLPYSIRQVISINVYDEFGKSEQAASTEKYYTNSVMILAHSVPILGAACFYFIPLIIVLFLPNYLKSIPILQLYILLSLFVCLIQTSQSVLVIMGKEFIAIAMYLMIALINVVLSLWQINQGHGGYYVLLAHFPGMIFYSIFVFVYILGMYGHKNKKLLNDFINVYFPQIYFCIMIMITKYIFGKLTAYSEPLKYLICGILLMVFIIPILISLHIKSTIFKDIKQMIKKQFQNQSSSA